MPSLPIRAMGEIRRQVRWYGPTNLTNPAKGMPISPIRAISGIRWLSAGEGRDSDWLAAASPAARSGIEMPRAAGAAHQALPRG